MSIGNIGTSGLSTSDSVELAAPVQISPLLKLLQLTTGDKYGDAVDRAWTSGVDPTGRTIVDVGHVLLANARLLYHRGDWRAGSGGLVFQIRLSLWPKVLEPGVWGCGRWVYVKILGTIV